MMFRILLLIAVVIVAVVPAAPAFADGDDDGLRAVPFAFVGTAADCAPFPAGSNIVTAAWLGGMGLPDNDGMNTQAADTVVGGTNPNKRDPHFGFLMSKNGPTADCSAAGATIKFPRFIQSVQLQINATPKKLRAAFIASLPPSAFFPPIVQGTGPTTIVMGYDYRNGGHCGAGAPRFNVVARPATGPDTFHFVGGCSNDTPTPAPQDPLQWTRVRFNTSNPAQSFPVIPVGSTIVSIDLIFDEGTDSTSVPDDARGVGLAVVDNIDINGRLIRSGRGIAPDPDDDHD